MSALPSRRPIRVAAVALLALACWGCAPAADQPEAAGPNVTAFAPAPASGTVSGARTAEPAASVPSAMPTGLPTPVTGQSEPAAPSATPTATPSAPPAPPAWQSASATPTATSFAATPKTTEPPEPAPQTPAPTPAPSSEPAAPTTGQPASPPPATIAEPDSLRRALTVFYIAVDDGGASGPLVGCGDSAVATTTAPVSFGNQVQASIEALLADDAPEHGQSGLVNTLQPSTLVYVSSFVQGDTVTVMLSGRVVSGGMCDDPRIEAQLAYTAKVAAGVGRAEIYVDGTPIGRLLGGK